LPPRIKVLYITTPERPGEWLAEAFAADSAAQIVLEGALGTAAGLARLRDEVFDALLVWHEPGELDALQLIEGYRAGGANEPVVVLGAQAEAEMAPLCFEVGADGYVCVPTATTRHLIWVVARAVQRQELVCQNQRFHQAELSRIEREHEETRRLLAQQRALVEPPQAEPRAVPWRAELLAHYRELLRVYVMMGAGNLAAELQRLAELLAAAGLTARQTLQLHIEAVEELIRGLGARSSRHVMNRADLLALEVMMDLAEGYRRRYAAGTRPPLQKRLPGLE
jgi:DNA-binding response OmpR family regulator